MAPLRRRSDPHSGASRRGSDPELASLEERLDRETASDLLDVPAAVVCARCGNVDCAGCENEEARSGIVAIVAWERTQAPVLGRLWSTARATTRDAEGFFELLPDGPVVPALRFAAACEILASLGMLAAGLVVAACVAPEWLKHVALDPTARAMAARALVLGVPSFAGLLVLAHAAHGLSIDVGARRNGARSARTRALRFGLYACGWDLASGPLGAVVVAFREGVSAAFDALNIAGVPTKATTAFLRGCYRLDVASAKRALSTSFVGAAVVTILAAVVVLAAIIAVLLV